MERMVAIRVPSWAHPAQRSSWDAIIRTRPDVLPTSPSAPPTRLIEGPGSLRRVARDQGGTREVVQQEVKQGPGLSLARAGFVHRDRKPGPTRHPTS